ncbi:MAG: hypothetical protein EXQ48_02160 [Acidobacteria bacterium]|nr:hypothetical protein [Acidobacteriota bacterium]
MTGLRPQAPGLRLARFLRWALSLVFCAWGLGPGAWGLSAQVNMPDPALIQGKAIPAGELPAGTVTVRVVREAIGNNIAGQLVIVKSGSTTREAKTDDQGRANFDNLQTGVEARAEATVNGERLVSDPFTPPSSGGLRVILVAGMKDAAARKQREDAVSAAAPPVKGVVVFNPNSRVMMEFRDDALQIFYVLEIVNNARARVDIGGPLMFDLPTGAAGASILEGSSPSATVSGDRVTVTGPFAAGVTLVQVGYTLPYTSSSVTVEQKWPAAMEQLTVAMQKIVTASMSSPQFATVGEVNAGDGTPYWLGSGAALPAGATLTIQLKDLPAHSQTPRIIALTTAGIVVLTGIWLAFGGRSKEQDAMRQLLSRRDTLLAELTAIEERRRTAASSPAGRGGPSGPPENDARRQKLIAELEQIYGELDEEGAGPQGGGEGVAA